LAGFHEGEQSGVDRDAACRTQAVGGLRDPRCWEPFVGRFVVHGRKGDLSHVVAALHASSGLSGSLDSRKEQSDQDSNDGYDHEQFDKGKALRGVHTFCAVGNLKHDRDEISWINE
jgi:hypothetical protein